MTLMTWRGSPVGRLAPVVIGLAGLLPPAAASADEPDGLAVAAALERAFTSAIEEAEKSVVSVSRDKVPAAVEMRRFQGFDPFPGRDRGDRSSGPEDPNWISNEFGAGIVIDPNGLILTNYHLVRGGPIEGRPETRGEQMLYVRLPDRRGFEARIFAADPRSDLAVLKIAAQNLRPIKLGNAERVRKGQFVIALGNPYAIARDGTASATWGIVSNISRMALPEPELTSPERNTRQALHHLGTLLQLDTRLELGTSGGALINLQGELIGITTSLAAIVGYEKSAGFAFPIDDAALRIIEALRQGKEVEYGFLGVGPSDVLPSSPGDQYAVVADRFKQHGAARIDNVLEQLPAHQGGLQVNDLVLRVGDSPILGSVDLMREIGLAAPGTRLRIKVWRPQLGREFDLTVEVGKWPYVDEEGIVASTRLRDPWRGVNYDYITARRRLFDQLYSARVVGPIGSPPTGVLVLDVQTDSPAAARGLEPRDIITHVNGTAVRTPAEFAEAVAGEKGAVALTVLAPGTSRSRQVEVPTR